jgi:hypothetical protein
MYKLNIPKDADKNFKTHEVDGKNIGKVYYIVAENDENKKTKIKYLNKILGEKVEVIELADDTAIVEPSSENLDKVKVDCMKGKLSEEALDIQIAKYKGKHIIVEVVKTDKSPGTSGLRKAFIEKGIVVSIKYTILQEDNVRDFDMMGQLCEIKSLKEVAYISSDNFSKANDVYTLTSTIIDTEDKPKMIFIEKERREQMFFENFADELCSSILSNIIYHLLFIISFVEELFRTYLNYEIVHVKGFFLNIAKMLVNFKKWLVKT